MCLCFLSYLDEHNHAQRSEEEAVKHISTTSLPTWESCLSDDIKPATSPAATIAFASFFFTFLSLSRQFSKFALMNPCILIYTQFCLI